MTPKRPFGLDSAWPLIGVVHLAALPGSPNWSGDLGAVRSAALRDAEAYRKGGIDALIVENYGDLPFTGGRVPAATVAAMAVMVEAVAREFGSSVGVNVLRNDGVSALAVAAATGARFVRINVLVGAMVADQGLIEGDAWNVLSARRNLAPDCRIWADVMVKHAVPVGAPRLEDLADDTWHRGMANALILSGAATGSAAAPEDFRRVRVKLAEAPLVVGSGLTLMQLPEMMSVADGAIVATSLKTDGRTDPEKVRRLVVERNRLLSAAPSAGGSA